MPIYEYRCQVCGANEEHVQRFSDPPMTQCQACGGALKKQISGAAFHLKGGGWYKDGYASTKPASGDAASSGASSDSGGTASSGSGDKGSAASGGSGDKGGAGSKGGDKGGSSAGSSGASKGSASSSK